MKGKQGHGRGTVTQSVTPEVLEAKLWFHNMQLLLLIDVGHRSPLPYSEQPNFLS